MTANKDYSGVKYNRLTAKAFAYKKGSTTFWTFMCDCGKEVTLRINNVVSGNTKSCGCYKTEVMSEFDRSTHGLYNTPLWGSFHGAKHRCNNPNDPDYSEYGGRGIKFCWNSIEDFGADLLSSYFTGATLERVDVDGDYCKENCIWETRKKQARNRRKTRANTSGVTGVSFCSAANLWRAEWRDLNSKVKTKSFSVKKYGSETAFLLACEARSIAIQSLNASGAGYSEKHGL